MRMVLPTVLAVLLLASVAEIKQLREWGLPLTLFTGGKWEARFYTDKEYLDAPAEQN